MLQSHKPKDRETLQLLGGKKRILIGEWFLAVAG